MVIATLTVEKAQKHFYAPVHHRLANLGSCFPPYIKGERDSMVHVSFKVPPTCFQAEFETHFGGKQNVLGFETSPSALCFSVWKPKVFQKRGKLLTNLVPTTTYMANSNHRFLSPVRVLAVFLTKNEAAAADLVLCPVTLTRAFHAFCWLTWSSKSFALSCVFAQCFCNASACKIF